MNRQYIIFLTVFCSILLFGGTYVNLRLATNFYWSLFYAAPFLFVAIAFIRMLASRRGTQRTPTRLQLFLQRLNFIFMGWLSFLFVFTILRDFALLFTPVDPRFVLLFSVASLIYGMVPALSGPKVKEVKVEVVDLHDDLDGFKIAQISDLHVGPFIGEIYISKVVSKLRSLSPSIIALTGDIFDSDYEHFHQQANQLSELAQFSKAYFASGNHEYYWESAKWFSFVERAGIKFLKNSNDTFKVGRATLQISGIVDPAARMIGESPNLGAAIAGQADFKILLAHQPQIADRAAEAGVDLQISGHTHGGQFFPWTLVVRRVHKYYQGLFRVAEKMWIYVSPGTGFWGPPVRLGTTPEVTLLTLTKKR